jgi:hypothetical protein
MRGDQLVRQWRTIRPIEASPYGLTVFEVAKREKNGVRTIPLHLEHLQAVRFLVNTPAYLDQIQSGMGNHLRKVAQLRVWLDGGILYLIGLCHLTESDRRREDVRPGPRILWSLSLIKSSAKLTRQPSSTIGLYWS